MKKKLFSHGTCLVVISSLLCSCASTEFRSYNHHAKRFSDMSTTEQAIVLTGAQFGLVGGLVAAAILPAMDRSRSRHSYEPPEVRFRPSKTEYLQAGPSSQVTPAPKQTKKANATKSSTDASGTEYLVR